MPTLEWKISSDKPQVKCHGASQWKQRETIKRNLAGLLQQMNGTVEKKHNSMGYIIYFYEEDHFGEKTKQQQKSPDNN